MSLIERAIEKLGASPAPANPKTDPATDAGRSTIEVAASRLQALAPAQTTPETAERYDAGRKAVGIEPGHSGMRTLETESRPTRETPARDTAHGAPPLQLNVPTLHARGFATPDGANAGASQEFRVIKRPLLANAFGREGECVPNGRRVMVTSSMPGEGKSHCAINLALSIAAERDHQVLLVDADVANPSIPRHLDVRVDSGLMDWLVDGEPDLAQLVRPTSIDKLSILGAGRRHEHATEFLASEAMGRLLAELTSRFPDHIFVFDSPPLMVTTESRVLASYMGQIVMVVEAGRTPRNLVDEALGMLPKDQVIGLVLNKSREGGAGGYYGYQGQAYGTERA